VTGKTPTSNPDAVHSPLPRLLTVQDLADLLQVPPKTIYAWRYKGMGPTAVPVGKFLRFRPEDVAAWLEARAEPPLREDEPVVARVGRRNLSTTRRRRRAPSTPTDALQDRPGNSPR
jgi:excisionase family DNA binding protein